MERPSFLPVQILLYYNTVGLTTENECKKENAPMKKYSFIILLAFIMLLFTSLRSAHAIAVDFSGATLVSGPYPYTVNDSLGLIGTTSDGFGNPNDIDYYKFWANAGATLTADIDNGFDGRDGGFITPGEDIDVLLTLFYDYVAGFIPYSTFGKNCGGTGLINADDAGCGIDADSNGELDNDPGSYITNLATVYTKDPFITYAVPSSGYYYLAVSIADNGYVASSGEFQGVSLGTEFPEGGTYTLTLNVTPVPEPSTIILVAAGLLFIVITRKRALTFCHFFIRR